MNTAEVYAKVTDRLIAQMEAGVVPWAKPWLAPMSIHGHVYRGINALILACTDYKSPIWLTFDQARKLGGHVRKGEKGTPVILWKQTKGKKSAAEGASDDSDETRRGFFCTTFTVFNIEQCEGITPPAALNVRGADPIEQADALAQSYLGAPGAPSLSEGGSGAWYSPSADLVNVPPRATFKSTHGYYSTLFHELTHSTGHAKRIGREGITDAIMFGSHKYAREELVAEMGAAFLCARAGIDNAHTVENSAAYLKNWLGVLKGDRKLLVQAASAAQKAVDLIAGKLEAGQEVEAA